MELRHLGSNISRRHVRGGYAAVGRSSHRKLEILPLASRSIFGREANLLLDRLVATSTAALRNRLGEARKPAALRGALLLGAAADPFLAAFVEFLLPERDALLQLVDQVTTG